MMAKMSDDDLISLLRGKEEESATYVHGQLAGEREKGMREYYREPLGNEEEGWSQIVSSDTQDSIEWILPNLLKVFTSTDQAVSFDPSMPEDVKAAQQATDACNYVFYRQNNGFLVLYTAFKDALIAKNCAVMWRKDTQKVVTTRPYQNLTEDELAYILSQGGELVVAEPVESIDPLSGLPMVRLNAKIKTEEEKNTVKVEAFPPEDLLVDRNWNTPMLQDCPYVCRLMRVTLSEIRAMGYKVDAEDMGHGDDAGTSADAEYRTNRSADSNYTSENSDESMTEGWLRIEFVLVDYDGDGIAERRCIYRLNNKILKNDTVSHVQIATASPLLNTHRWDGQSMAELVSDLMQLRTEVMRQTLNSLYLANNPRTKVMTDSNWSPQANLDDLLDSRPGGIIRQKTGDAVQEHITPFVGAQAFPMLEYIDGMRESRTGVSKQQQGLDPDSLNRTKGGTQMIMGASAQRIELMARIFAETLVKPIFQGILKLLADGGMDKLAFRLRNEFVQLDPNEWRDQYDMSINVGLGTGDKDQQAAHLMAIFQSQMNLIPMGLATPKEIYHTQSKITENAGFKNVNDFWVDPTNNPPPQPPAPPPPYQIQVKQMELQAEQMKFQAESQITRELEELKARAKLQEVQANLELQAANDERDAEREMMKAVHQQELERMKLELDKYKVDQDNQTRILVAQIGQGEKVELPIYGEEKPDPLMMMTQAIQMLSENMNRPKSVVRDENGKVIGVQ